MAPCSSATAKGEPFEVGITDPTGHATLHGLAPGLYDVVARCRDHLATVAAEPVELVAGRTEERTYRVPPGLELKGRVVDAGGAAAPDVALTLFGGGGATVMQGATSGPDGSFVLRGLEPGPYTLRVSAEPLADPPPIAVELDETTAPLTIELPPSEPLEGRVVDSTGDPVAGVRVRAIADLHLAQTYSDDEGRFTLALAPGGYQLRATADDGTSAPEQTIEVPRSAGPVIVELPRRVGRIVGTVVDEDGAPLADVWVQAQPDDGSRPGVGETEIRSRGLGGTAPRALSDADGRFELTSIGAGPHTVLAQRRCGGEAARGGVEAGQDIELAFPRLATVAGTATLPEGSLPTAMVVSLREASTGLERTESFGGGRGHWGFDELPPGRYRVAVRSIEGAGATDVALEAGQERRDLVVPLQPRVIVTVVMRDLDTDEPLAEVDVSALDREASIPDLAAEAEKGLAMGNRERRSDAGGRLVIRRPPGPSRALVLHSNFERGEYGPHFATIDVPHGVERAELTLYLVRNRLPPKTPPVDLGYSYAGPMFCDGNEVGTVQDGGLAQQAGLRVGDEIVAIDGHDVSDSRCYLRDWLLRVPPGDTVELTLARGDVLQLGTSAP